MANANIVGSINEQIRELQPGIIEQFGASAILAELTNLSTLTDGTNKVKIDAILNPTIALVTQIQNGAKNFTDFETVLGNLDTIIYLMDDTSSVSGKSILKSVISQIGKLLRLRPGVEAILGDLEVIKNLKGGPADATAFHDFHVLQMAFKNVWTQAFDKTLGSLAEQLYYNTVDILEGKGFNINDVDISANADIADLKQFIDDVQSLVDLTYSPPPKVVSHVLPEQARVWNLLSIADQQYYFEKANQAQDAWDNRGDEEVSEEGIRITNEANEYFRIHPVTQPTKEPSLGNLVNLLVDIKAALEEPYAFDVFAPNAFNYGIMLTYRQKWEPLEYQAGDLVSTIPLAPGETRKYSKKRVIKKSRAEKEIEKSMSSSSLQTSDITRAEDDIMKKATTATNFKMSASGSFNIGIGSMNASTEFGLNQALESVTNKKQFHEATLKAAEEYRLERSIEIDTSTSEEFEETSSGEISNPNNEITVTYLFYELQRRYRITENIYRARPVIMVAQDVPAPHEINESWLLQYQWIISRVLLDDSLRPSLDYLTSGFAGDELSTLVLKTQWENQIKLAKSLEGQVQLQLTMRDGLRDTLVKTAENKKKTEAIKLSTGLKILSLGLAPDPGEIAADMLEAQREAAETRLGYVEQALADAQSKLKQATDTLQRATTEYAEAMKNKYSRRVAIDQLRLHVKQNILYYMQAIYAHEPADQRFFRLYNKPVWCTEPRKGCVTKTKISKDTRFLDETRKVIRFSAPCVPELEVNEVDLIEIADLDNPVGYKGNYIIFPLKEHCYITTFMLSDFIDNYLGIKDPDKLAEFDLDKFDAEWKLAAGDLAKRTELRNELTEYLSFARRSSDEIIVPTGQLFIEALPGFHPLLEDFKLLHRIEDVRKVKAEVRHAELENLRLAARLLENQNDPNKDNLLEDPDIEKRIIVEGASGVNVGDNN